MPGLAAALTGLSGVPSVLAVSARQKNAQTIIYKLRQHPGMSLANMGDIAGVRLIVNGGRIVQDAVARAVCAKFGVDPTKIRDKRREHRDSAGYRAVHVEVRLEGVRAEVQVRTPLQDRWAQTNERVADHWGRQIRYGGEPDHADACVQEGQPTTRREVVAEIQNLADEIADVEQFEMREVSPVRRAARWLLPERIRRLAPPQMRDRSNQSGRDAIENFFEMLAKVIPGGPPTSVAVEHFGAATGEIEHFLVGYRRSSGVLQRVCAFPLSKLEEAIRRRTELELQHRNDPDFEIVLLLSGSQTTLERTHARYFKNARHLAEGGLD